jgi:hypothetical protein
LNHVEELGGLTGFVRLQVADEMKARAGKVFDERLFGFEFLDVIFAELAQAAGVGFLNRGGGKDLADGEQEYFVAAAAGLSASPLKTILQIGQAAGEGGGGHW